MSDKQPGLLEAFARANNLPEGMTKDLREALPELKERLYRAWAEDSSPDAGAIPEQGMDDIVDAFHLMGVSTRDAITAAGAMPEDDPEALEVALGKAVESVLIAVLLTRELAGRGREADEDYQLDLAEEGDTFPAA